MAGITDLGGINLFADDPAALAQWYADHLGIQTTYDEATKMYQACLPSGARFHVLHIEPWMTVGHSTVGILLRADDLDGLAKHLESRGVKVELVNRPPHPRHANLTDLEGRAITILE